jgi:hypothetical protein
MYLGKFLDKGMGTGALSTAMTFRIRSGDCRANVKAVFAPLKKPTKIAEVNVSH